MKLSSSLLVSQWQTLGCQTFLGKIFLSVFQWMGLGFIVFALQIHVMLPFSKHLSANNKLGKVFALQISYHTSLL
jgi:hypothetical protein